MIEALTCLALAILFGFLIILPIYVNLFKNEIYEYIKDRIDEEAEMKELRDKIKTK